MTDEVARPFVGEGSKDGLPSSDLPLRELPQSSPYESRDRVLDSSDVGVMTILVGLVEIVVVVVVVLVAELLVDLKSRFMALRRFKVVFWRVVFGWR